MAHSHDDNTNDNIRVLTAHEVYILASTMHVISEAGKAEQLELKAVFAAIESLATHLVEACTARLASGMF